MDVQLPGACGADGLRRRCAGDAHGRQRHRSPTARTPHSSPCRRSTPTAARRASSRPGRSPASARSRAPARATVEVVAIVETPKVPANNYAAFATAASCGAMTSTGNVTVDSYDSTADRGRGPEHGRGGRRRRHERQPAIGGSVEVQGNLYTPRTGVGTCEEGAVTALTETGSAEVTGSIIQLPTVVDVSAAADSGPPSTTPTVDSARLRHCRDACARSLGLWSATGVCNCNVSGSNITIGADRHGRTSRCRAFRVDGGYHARSSTATARPRIVQHQQLSLAPAASKSRSPPTGPERGCAC